MTETTLYSFYKRVMLWIGIVGRKWPEEARLTPSMAWTVARIIWP
jgi:hypothetical protein